MEKFRKLGINEKILKQLSEMKFENPTEIQEKAIPLVLAGKDVIAGASTGSGKTLAFAADIIENCEKLRIIQALVLVPTRELADQVAESIRNFSTYKELNIEEVYGGVSMGPQVQKLKKADVVVGTPGRILDHLERQTIDFSYVKILVLDEADRMLDMGFIDDVKRIVEECPIKRQTLLFSATISKDISRLAKDYMTHPVEVSAESYVDPSKLTQIYYDVQDNMKFSLLVHLLKQEHAGLVMVFCNTQRNTDFVAKNLYNNGVDAVAIHGGLSQDRRSRIMDSFHEKKVYVLVCTDVAARGLDIKGVSHVYNYDIPQMADQYIHRIGRTARAGKEGKAVNILSSRDYDNFIKIKRMKEFDIKREEVPEIQRVNIVVERRYENRGRSGGYGGHGGGYRGGGGGGRSFGGSRGGGGGFRRDNFRRNEGQGGGFRGGGGGGGRDFHRPSKFNRFNRNRNRNDRRQSRHERSFGR